MAGHPTHARTDKGKAKAKPSSRGQKKELERRALEELQKAVDEFVRLPPLSLLDEGARAQLGTCTDVQYLLGWRGRRRVQRSAAVEADPRGSQVGILHAHDRHPAASTAARPQGQGRARRRTDRKRKDARLPDPGPRGAPAETVGTSRRTRSARHLADPGTGTLLRTHDATVNCRTDDVRSPLRQYKSSRCSARLAATTNSRPVSSLAARTSRTSRSGCRG